MKCFVTFYKTKIKKKVKEKKENFKHKIGNIGEACNTTSADWLTNLLKLKLN